MARGLLPPTQHTTAHDSSLSSEAPTLRVSQRRQNESHLRYKITAPDLRRGCPSLRGASVGGFGPLLPASLFIQFNLGPPNQTHLKNITNFSLYYCHKHLRHPLTSLARSNFSLSKPSKFNSLCSRYWRRKLRGTVGRHRAALS